MLKCPAIRAMIRFKPKSRGDLRVHLLRAARQGRDKHHGPAAVRLLPRHPPLLRGFDADPHEPDYAPRFGERVANVDLANVQGQIAMIDRLLVADREPKIVDLWSRSFTRFFGLAQEIGFFDEARGKGVTPVILFHADGAEASTAAAYRLAATFPGVETLLVHNEGAAPLGGQAGERLANERLAAYPPHRRLKIRALDAACARRWSRTTCRCPGC